MHVDESLPSHIRKSVCRRTLFVIALLGTGSAVSFLTGAYSYDRGHPFGMFGDHSWGTKSFFLSLDRQVTGFSGFWITSMFPLPLDRYCNAFIWGIDFSLVVVLGAWLVLRYRWWETWFGRFRATIYTIAFFYGSILTTATQRWINDLAPNGYPRDANSPFVDGSLCTNFGVHQFFVSMVFPRYRVFIANIGASRCRIYFRIASRNRNFHFCHRHVRKGTERTLEDHGHRSNRNTGVGYIWRQSDLSRNRLRWTFPSACKSVGWPR